LKRPYPKPLEIYGAKNWKEVEKSFSHIGLSREPGSSFFKIEKYKLADGGGGYHSEGTHDFENLSPEQLGRIIKEFCPMPAPNSIKSTRKVQVYEKSDTEPHSSIDIRITRANCWALNEGKEIFPDEWIKVVKSDKELELVEGSQTHSAQFLADKSIHETVFELDDGNIYARKPSRSAITKMIVLAKKLNARVVDEDDNDINVGMLEGM
jgi:hypothetical protein